MKMLPTLTRIMNGASIIKAKPSFNHTRRKKYANTTERKRLSPQEIFEIMSERHANEFLEASSPPSLHSKVFSFFHGHPHPHGEEKIPVNKEVLLWWKAIINFFGCLHLLFFLFRGDGRQKKGIIFYM